MVHGLRHGLLPLEIHPDWVLADLGGHLLDLVRVQRGGEHQALEAVLARAGFGKFSEELEDLVPALLVVHKPVGLVKDVKLHLVHLELPGFHKVQNPRGRSHHHVVPFLQRLDLVLGARAAHQRDTADRGVVPEAATKVRNHPAGLLRKVSGGLQNQRERGPRAVNEAEAPQLAAHAARVGVGRECRLAPGRHCDGAVVLGQVPQRLGGGAAAPKVAFQLGVLHAERRVEGARAVHELFGEVEGRAEAPTVEGEPDLGPLTLVPKVNAAAHDVTLAVLGPVVLEPPVVALLRGP